MMKMDRIERMADYAIPHLDVLEAFMHRADIDTLEPGKYALDSGCKVSVITYDSKPESKMEAHRQYIDVQVLLEGEETVLYAPIEYGTPATEYNPEKDVQFYTAPDARVSRVRLTAGNFMVFYPADMHAPNLADGYPVTHNRKLVFKIPVND